MRKKIAVVGVVSLVAMLGSVHASTITSVTTSDGSILTVSDGLSGADSLVNYAGNANLVEFAAGGVVYQDLTPGTAVTSSGSPGRIWEIGGSDPGVSQAGSDLNLATGLLNPGNGLTTVYDLTGLTTDASTTFFIFSNGGSPFGDIIFVDSVGAAITTAYSGTGLGGVDELELGSLQHSRSGSDLSNRIFQGFTFTTADFTFDTGKTADDIAGFVIPDSDADWSDFGIAAIPEPATLGLVAVFGGAVLFIRRRFMI